MRSITTVALSRVDEAFFFRLRGLVVKVNRLFLLLLFAFVFDLGLEL